MENERMISLETVCTHYNIEYSFVHSLGDYGLIQIIKKDEQEFIAQDCLSEIELLMHLHYDLEINFEGIDAISHLLGRVREMQRELVRLRNSSQ
ncbi:MAG: chaperone modulator CbpM [bacterium]|nr:chaperone modulator CbpM [bacterium]